MNKNNFKTIALFFITLLICQLAFGANQLETQVNGIKENMILLAQAFGGITLCVGFIIWNAGDPGLGQAVAKGGAMGVVGATLLPVIIGFLKGLGA